MLECQALHGLNNLPRPQAHLLLKFASNSFVVVVVFFLGIFFVCGGLKNGSHKSIGSGTNRRYGLVGVGVALLEEVYHWGWVGFEVSDSQARPNGSLLFLLPTNLDVELSAPFLAPCLSVCCHASQHDNNELNL